MTKSELITKISEETSLEEKDAKAAVNSFIETVLEELRKGETVKVAGLGTFKLSNRETRTCRNPKTGALVTVDAASYPKLKFSRTVLDTFRCCS